MSEASSRRSSRNIKTLSENFFENLLILEMKLKREFAMDTLQEIVNLYTVKI
jgi:hypothetical protein